MDKGDIITLSDDVKYLVTNLLDYQDVVYYLIIDLKNTNNHKIIFFSDKDEVEEIEDKNLLARIVLLMTKNIIE